MLSQFQSMYHCNGIKIPADEYVMKYLFDQRIQNATTNMNNRIDAIKHRIDNDYKKCQFNKKYQVNGYHEAKIIKHYIQNKFNQFAYYYDHKPNLIQTNDQMYKKIKLPVIYVKFSRETIPDDYVWPKNINTHTYFDCDGNINTLQSLPNTVHHCKYCNELMKKCINCEMQTQQCLNCGYVGGENHEINKLYVMYCPSCI